jgi:hypothetical protein
MSRGGKRAGAGRKRGSLTKKTREIAERAAADGITPLEVLLGAMREAWASGNRTLAAGFAKNAAPYCHPRLAAIEHSGKAVREVTAMSDDELIEIIRRGSNGRGNGVPEPAHGSSVHNRHGSHEPMNGQWKTDE